MLMVFFKLGAHNCEDYLRFFFTDQNINIHKKYIMKLLIEPLKLLYSALLSSTFKKINIKFRNAMLSVSITYVYFY